MTLFGLDRHGVAELVARVRPPLVSEASPDVPARAADGSLGPDELAEVFARASWSVITEPGDRAASELIGALGAPAALELIVAGASTDSITGAMAERGGAPVDSAVIDAALNRWRPRVSSVAVRRAIEHGGRRGVRFIVPGDSAWPTGLDDLGDGAPLSLWALGDLDRLEWFDRAIAIVGARAATGYGDHVAAEFSAGLAERGWAIVSGGAYGIDGTAHRLALAVDGRTIAFLAGGLDRFYPAGHDELLTTIADRGLVISEVPCGVAPTRWRFLMRNRLMAAASSATIVIEAGARSGSLNTAHHAAELGRPLGAVPGPITSPSSTGCHRILRELPSECVTSVEEIEALAQAASFDSSRSGGVEHADSPERVRVIDALSRRRPRDIDDIAKRTGMSLVEVTRVLGPLELERRVEERGGGWVLTS